MLALRIERLHFILENYQGKPNLKIVFFLWEDIKPAGGYDKWHR